jgi:hypothetical protein
MAPFYQPKPFCKQKFQKHAVHPGRIHETAQIPDLQGIDQAETGSLARNRKTFSEALILKTQVFVSQ